MLNRPTIFHICSLSKLVVKIGSVFDYFPVIETFFFPVENDLFLHGNFPVMDSLNSVVDFLQEFVYHTSVIVIQGNFI